MGKVCGGVQFSPLTFILVIYLASTVAWGCRVLVLLTKQKEC